MFIRGIGYFNEELVVAVLTHEEGALLVLPDNQTMVIKRNVSWDSPMYEIPQANQTGAERLVIKIQETISKWNELVDKFLKNSVYKGLKEKREQYEKWWYDERKKSNDLEQQLELYKAGVVRGNDNA